MSIDASFTRVSFPALGAGAHDKVEAAARVKGHAAGYIAGIKAAAEISEQRDRRREAEFSAAAEVERARSVRALATLTAATIALNQRTLPVIADAQDALAAAAIDIAEAVIGHELSTGVASARSALTRALTSVNPSDIHIVRMNPADLDELTDDIRSAAAVEFSADPTLARGDAVTEFAEGYLDARIASAVARVRAALVEER